MKNWISLALLLGFGIALATTYHTIPIEDKTFLFSSDESFVTSTPDVFAYCTWDGDNIYLAYKAPKLVWDPNDTLKINDQSIFFFIDTDPQKNPKSGLGSDTTFVFKTQISPIPHDPPQPGDALLPIWDNQQWVLPFHADYVLNIENPAVNLSDVTLVPYDNVRHEWYGGTDIDSTIWEADTTAGFVKLKLPLDSLSNPTEINILGYIVSSEWTSDWYDLQTDFLGFVWGAKRDIGGTYGSWPANSLEGGDGDKHMDGRFTTFYSWYFADGVSPTASNNKPLTENDFATTDEDNSVQVSVLSNDSEPDAQPLSVGAVRKPANGSATHNGTTVTYTPDANFFGQDTMVYTAIDGAGGFQVATVYITVNAVNDAPVVANDSVSTSPNSEISVAVLSNDYEVEGEQMTITSVTDPSNGSVVFNDSMITYTPATDFHGFDSFDYTVEDIHGAASTATVTVAVNDRPVAVNDTSQTSEESALLIGVLLNDSDPDNDALTVSALFQPVHGTLVNNGTSVTYTPAENFFGSDSFRYVADDGFWGRDTATVFITVTNINDRPLAVDDDVTIDEDSTVVIDVLLNDSDPDGEEIAIHEVHQPLHGTATNNGDTTITYQPTANYAGADSFTYVISDPNTSLDTAWVRVTINPVNDAPQIVSLPDEMFIETGGCGTLYMADYQSDVDTPDSLLSWTFTTSDPALTYTYSESSDTLEVCSDGPAGQYYLYATLSDDQGAEDKDTIIVHVDDPSSIAGAAEIPTVYSLSQNYPNPFNPVTSIRYGLPRGGLVKLEVYNVTGQRILTLVKEEQQAGYHVVRFDASRFASGLYFYRIKADKFNRVRKMMLMK